MPIRWRSVRVQTTLIASAVVAATLLMASYLLIATLHNQLQSNGDAASRNLANALAESAADGTLSAVISVSDGSMAQVVSVEGSVLAASANLGSTGQLTTVPLNRTPRLVVIEGVPDDADRETYRVWARTASTPTGEVRILAGTSPEQAAEAVQALRSSLILGVPAVLVVLAAAIWALTARALRPVELIRAQVAEISGTALERRVPTPNTGDEIERLAHTMNDMLGRLDDSARQQREFVADASHELQSPLAAFRAQLEVAQTHPEGTDWSALNADLLADSDRMERLVRDLLFLAREDSAEVSSALVPVDLDTVMLEEVGRLRSRKGVTINTCAVSAGPVLGRSEDLGRMVRNVLENAADHALANVTITLGIHGHHVVLQIQDDGAGVPDELRDRIFDRFVRAESDRSRGEYGGTGLGLPIALAIARRHGGDAFLESGDAGTTVKITLPAA